MEVTTTIGPGQMQLLQQGGSCGNRAWQPAAARAARPLPARRGPFHVSQPDEITCIMVQP
jgi:spermidine/putrescine-binding protein